MIFIPSTFLNFGVPHTHLAEVIEILFFLFQCLNTLIGAAEWNYTDGSRREQEKKNNKHNENESKCWDVVNNNNNCSSRSSYCAAHSAARSLVSSRNELQIPSQKPHTLTLSSFSALFFFLRCFFIADVALLKLSTRCLCNWTNFFCSRWMTFVSFSMLFSSGKMKST